MAITSVIHLSELENHIRIEAEFYQPKYLEIEKFIKKLRFELLRRVVSKISDGTHFTPNYVERGVKFFSALNVKENYFDYEDKHKFITQAEHETLYRRCNPEAKDVLIRKVGVGPRWSCVISEGLPEFSIFVSIALLKVKRYKVNPYFLSAFINSKYGQSQLLRLQKGASQPDLHLEDIAELKVPIIEDDLQNLIQEKIQLGEYKLRAFNEGISKAEHELAAGVRFKTESHGTPKGFTVNLSKIVSNKRSDAQCYHPEITTVEQFIENRCNYDYFGTLATSIIKGQQRVPLKEGIVPYVSIKDINDLEIKPNSFCNNPISVATKEDILIAVTGATIGKVGIVDKQDKIAFSGDLMAIKVDKSKINPWYLLCVINHQIGQTQLKKWITGSTNGHLASHDIKKILVPRLKKEMEDYIGQLIETSLKSKSEGFQLLAEAILEVEKMIEQLVREGSRRLETGVC